MQEKIKNLITEALQELDIDGGGFVVEHPEDLKNGDYSTNVAMVCAKKLKTNPKELAEKIVVAMSRMPLDTIKKVEAKGGFINFYLSPKFFAGSIEEILNNQKFGENNLFAKKKVMIEYTDPNPFKPFHIGHLMSNAIGESISRIVKYSGAEVKRANYQGDVGLHTAKAIWALMRRKQRGLTSLFTGDEVLGVLGVLGEAYAEGVKAYDENDIDKEEIKKINKKIYDKNDNEINSLYENGRKISLEHFEEIYKKLGTKFDYYFFESETGPIGKELVKKNI